MSASGWFSWCWVRNLVFGLLYDDQGLVCLCAVPRPPSERARCTPMNVLRSSALPRVVPYASPALVLADPLRESSTDMLAVSCVSHSNAARPTRGFPMAWICAPAPPPPPMPVFSLFSAWVRGCVRLRKKIVPPPKKISDTALDCFRDTYQRRSCT